MALLGARGVLLSTQLQATISAVSDGECHSIDLFVHTLEFVYQKHMIAFMLPHVNSLSDSQCDNPFNGTSNFGILF